MGVTLMPVWKSIGSAPRDGADILVFCEDTCEQFVAYWDKDAWIYARVNNLTKVACEPSHWMPIPEPPHAP